MKSCGNVTLGRRNPAFFRALWFLPNVPALQKQPQCFYVSADARNLTMANIDDDDDDDEEEGKEQESEEADLPKRKMIATLKVKVALSVWFPRVTRGKTCLRC